MLGPKTTKSACSPPRSFLFVLCCGRPTISWVKHGFQWYSNVTIPVFLFWARLISFQCRFVCLFVCFKVLLGPFSQWMRDGTSDSLPSPPSLPTPRARAFAAHAQGARVRVTWPRTRFSTAAASRTRSSLKCTTELYLCSRQNTRNSSAPSAAVLCCACGKAGLSWEGRGLQRPAPPARQRDVKCICDFVRARTCTVHVYCGLQNNRSEDGDTIPERPRKDGTKPFQNLSKTQFKCGAIFSECFWGLLFFL